MSAQVDIRHLADRDLEAVNDIYNYYVRETPITFDIEPISLDRRREWAAAFRDAGPHQCFVAEAAEGVVGFAYSRAFRPKAAYATSVEVSIYLDPDAQGRGIGTRLYRVLLDALGHETVDVHRAYAAVTMPNPASEALHRAFGFREVGLYSEVGRKFGRFWDGKWFEKEL